MAPTNGICSHDDDDDCPCVARPNAMIWYWSINIPKLAGFILRPFDKFWLWKVVQPRSRGSTTTFEHNFYWDTFSLSPWSMEKNVTGNPKHVLHSGIIVFGLSQAATSTTPWQNSIQPLWTHGKRQIHFQSCGQKEKHVFLIWSIQRQQQRKTFKSVLANRCWLEIWLRWSGTSSMHQCPTLTSLAEPNETKWVSKLV